MLPEARLSYSLRDVDAMQFSMLLDTPLEAAAEEDAARGPANGDLHVIDSDDDGGDDSSNDGDAERSQSPAKKMPASIFAFGSMKLEAGRPNRNSSRGSKGSNQARLCPAPSSHTPHLPASARRICST